jgi:hypothetical protein
MTAGEPSRAEIRAFVRAHHPDVGGDPDEFIAGLEELRRRGEPDDGPEEDSARYDGPVTFVVTPKGVVGRVRRWRGKRRREPRVR